MPKKPNTFLIKQTKLIRSFQKNCVDGIPSDGETESSRMPEAVVSHVF